MAKRPPTENWINDLSKIEALCEIDGMTIARLLKILDKNMPADHYDGRSKNYFNEKVAETLKWRRYKSGGAVYRIAPVDGRYAVISSTSNNEVIVPTIADLVDPNTAAVVELGCGTGRNLFHLRDIIEHEFPGVRYFGCEIAEAGLKSGETIASLEPKRDNISFRYFNYLEPDLGFLQDLDNIIFFTCHSIEQVTHIGENIFHEILRTGQNIQCVHCEPVGWQFNKELMAKLEEKGKKLNDTKVNVEVLGSVNDYYSAEIPVINDWNRNLVETLLKLQNDGLLKINFIERDCVGNNAYNPSTLIHWTKVLNKPRGRNSHRVNSPKN